MDAQRSFPPRDIPLETKETTAWFQKLEVHKGIYWYSTDPHSNANLVAIPVKRVKEIQALNKKGLKADRLLEVVESAPQTSTVSEDLLKNNSLTRFDPPPNKNQGNRNANRRKNRRFNDKKNT
jgi:hypothetical protein